MIDDFDELFASRPTPPASYWEALRTIAGQHGVDVQLLHWSPERNEPPQEALFYLKLARALLSEADNDPADTWISAILTLAISVIDRGSEPIKFNRRRSS